MPGNVWNWSLWQAHLQSLWQVSLPEGLQDLFNGIRMPGRRDCGGVLVRGD